MSISNAIQPARSTYQPQDLGTSVSNSFFSTFAAFSQRKRQQELDELNKKRTMQQMQQADQLFPLALEKANIDNQASQIDLDRTKLELFQEQDFIQNGGLNNAGEYKSGYGSGSEYDSFLTPLNDSGVKETSPVKTDVIDEYTEKDVITEAPTGKRVPASIRYNNPGAMYPGPSAKKFGTTGTEIIGGGHKIAVFPDAESGAAAQFDLLANNYTDMTVKEAISKWSGGNSVGTYLEVIQKETGLSPSDKLTRDQLSDPSIAIPLAKAMAKQESGRQYPLTQEGWLSAHKRALGG